MSIQTKPSTAEGTADLDHQLRCEVGATFGGRRDRPASWLLDCHGCSTGLACAEHLASWERHTAAALGACRGAQCNKCERVFFAIADIYTVVRAL